MELPDEIYPNQPLAEVVFEVRFPGEVRIECERHLFWEQIREDYPNVIVPHPNPDKPLALMPYKFRDKEGAMTVMVSMNTFALSANIYPGYKEFSKEILRVYKLFGQTFSTISEINRVGWRYINIIPFVREKGLIPLTRFLKVGFDLPPSIPKSFNNMNLVFDTQHGDGSIISRIQALQKVADSRVEGEAILLDIDYGKIPTGEQELNFQDVPKYLDEAHLKTRQLFEEFITDEYRQFLRGDVL